MSIPGTRAITALLRVAAIPVLVFLALAAWALSSPVGSSPDEDYHLSSIWCGQGLEKGVCESSPVAGERRVPEALPSASACFAFHPEQSAQCQSRWFAPEARNLVDTNRGNFDGTYPPVFYFTMHFFVGQDISRSVIIMRLVNAALFVGLMTVTYRLLPRRRRTMLVFGTAVALVPLGVFLIPSINPSGWAITSAAVVFPALVGFFETTGRRRIALAALTLLAAVMGAGARADSAIYTVLAAGLATLVALPNWRTSWRLLSVPAAVTLVAALFYLSAGQSGLASTGFSGASTASSPLRLAVDNLLNVPGLWAGAMGAWGLGWLDTTMPSIVWVINLATLGGLVYLGLRQSSWRKAVALVLALVAVWGIPTVILVESRTVVGAQVQPRYILPLIVLLAEIALFRVAAREPQARRTSLLVAGGALGITNLVALYTNFRRYVTGLDVPVGDLDVHREWWWALPVPPTPVWAVGSVAFLLATLLCALVVARDDAETTSTDIAAWSPRAAPAAGPVERHAAA